MRVQDTAVQRAGEGAAMKWTRYKPWTRDTQGIFRRGAEAIIRCHPIGKPQGWYRGQYWAWWNAKGPFKTLKAAKRGR